MTQTKDVNGVSFSEATVTINGHKLSFAESMTLRVALETYLLQLEEMVKDPAKQPPGVLDNYRVHGQKIREFMVATSWPR